MKITLILTLFTAVVNFGSAQTYYGYQPRPSSSYVDWAQIGQNMSSAISNASQQRQARLEAAGWSSEWEYRNYVKSIKLQARIRKQDRKIQQRQMKLKSEYHKGNKKIKTRKDENGKIIYFKD